MRGQRELETGYILASCKINSGRNLSKAPISSITLAEARELLKEELQEWIDSIGSVDELQELADVIACACIAITRLQDLQTTKDRGYVDG